MNKIANYISSQDYIDANNLNNDEPSEQDIRDMHQAPLYQVIKPIKSQLDDMIKAKIKDLFTAKFRHYIHQHKNDTNLEKFIFDQFPFDKVIFYPEDIRYDFFDTFFHCISPGQLLNELKQYVANNFNDYINELIQYAKHEKILSIDEQNNKDYLSNIYIRRPDQLRELLDNIGDTIQLDQSFNINYKCRSNAFIFVYNKADIGHEHIELMENYMKKHNINDPFFFNEENLIKNKIPYAYGHINYECALINYKINTTSEDVKNALLKEGKYKVYDYNTKKQTLYRLARR